MTTRVNNTLFDAGTQLEQLKVAPELEQVHQLPFSNQADYYLFSLGSCVSSALGYLKVIAESVGSNRRTAYSQFCMSMAVATTYYDENRIIPDEHVFERSVISVFNLLNQLTARPSEQESDSLIRIGIACNQSTGALALLIQTHMNRLLGVVQEEETLE